MELKNDKSFNKKLQDKVDFQDKIYDTVKNLDNSGTIFFNLLKLNLKNKDLFNKCQEISFNIYRKDNNNYKQIYSEGRKYPVKEVFLASVTKPAFADLFLNLYPEDSRIEISRTEFKNIIKEINIHKSFAIEHQDNELIKVINKVKKAGNNIFSPNLCIDIKDLLILLLVLSYNVPLEIIKKRILERLDAKSIDYIKHIKERYGFEPAINTGNNYHWYQEKPNIGNAGKIGDLLNSFNEDNLIFKILDKYHCDFKYNFYFTNIAKLLKNRGYRIIEKTGFYPNVCYINYFSKKYPAFMTLLDVFTIIDMKGERNTYIAYNMAQIPFPEGFNLREKVEIEGKQCVINFPDIDNIEYNQLLVKMAKGLKEKFSERVSNTVYEDYKNNLK